MALVGAALGVFLTLGDGLVRTTAPGQVYGREQAITMLTIGGSDAHAVAAAGSPAPLPPQGGDRQ